MTTEMVGAPVASWWKGERGEWYVALQAGLFVLVAFGPATAPGLPAWPAAITRLSSWLGLVLLVSGFVWVGAGGVQLACGRSLSALPHPKATATLIDTGAFALVRHPMYCGAIWAAVGWALSAQGLLSLAYAALLIVFFDMKASREERALAATFPDYRAYCTRVRKLMPFVY